MTLDVIFCSDVQPDDHFDFYGFSRYARELNELTPELEAVLPPTDTRFRPDQRFGILFFFFNIISNEVCSMYLMAVFFLNPSFALFSMSISSFKHASLFSFLRLLEEGKVAEADKRKDEVEEKQRERRKEMAKRGEEHIPRFFR